MNYPETRTSKFNEELKAASAAREARAWAKQWRHLERAHVLGQFNAFQHLYVHLMMIRFSIARHQVREFFGQIPRIILAIPGSVTKLAPRGNTGGSNVGIFEKMEVPLDLKPFLNGKH